MRGCYESQQRQRLVVVFFSVLLLFNHQVVVWFCCCCCWWSLVFVAAAYTLAVVLPSFVSVCVCDIRVLRTNITIKSNATNYNVYMPPVCPIGQHNNRVAQ